MGSRLSLNSPVCPDRLNVRLNAVDAVTCCDGVWMVAFSMLATLAGARGRIERAIHVSSRTHRRLDSIPDTCPMKKTRHVIKKRMGCDLIADYQVHSCRS